MLVLILGATIYNYNIRGSCITEEVHNTLLTPKVHDLYIGGDCITEVHYTLVIHKMHDLYIGGDCTIEVHFILVTHEVTFIWGYIAAT